MALNLTTAQKALLRSSNLKIRMLSTWYLDSGVFRFSDDTEDVVHEGLTWIGANALASVSEIKTSNSGMAAEPIKIIIDGTRMYQSGFEDPAELFRAILEEDLHNRRVDVACAISHHDSETWDLIVPLFSGKINHPKLVDPSIGQLGQPGQEIQPNLEILIDSLALRYRWSTQRTRSHEDQLEIDPTDMFFSHVHNNLRNEGILYWGKKAPSGAGTSSNFNPSVAWAMQYMTGVNVTRAF